MSIAKHHAEWLSLIEVSGPFLSLPVLVQRFPQGMDAHDPEHARTLRQVHEEWDQDQNGGRPDRAIHRQWIDWVLRNMLDLGEVLVEGQDIPQTLKAELPEHSETLRPDKVVMEPGGSRARLLIQAYPLRQKLGRVVEGKPWAASPDTRMMQLLHDTGVRLGLVTNGDQWMLVDAPKGETTGYASWFAPLWLEEPKTLQAFRTLLGVHRFFGVPEEETLERLLAQSAQDQQEVTDQLGYQVRQAVEVLVSSIDRANRDSGGALLKGVPEPVLYEAALTVMMRLVFLFCAEERELLLLGDELYDRNYAVSTLREQLEAAAKDFGEEVLERRQDAWSRLLTTFRAVYGGVRHDRLKLPAYRGKLFDPDRFPFLEGRPAGTRWRDTPAQPLPVDNRTVLHLLKALQVLQVRLPGGGPPTPRKLSFRALQITQIGHVYEGLLDHTAVRATEPVLGLSGSRDSEPEVPLSKLEALAAKGEDDLLKFLKSETGRSSVATVKRLLDSKPDDQTLSRFRTACQGDESLWERVRPFAGLVRLDTFDYPVVVPPGGVYVTAGTDRRSSGTHYTPESLTEPIVRHTLEPLVYDGPAEGKPREEWRLKSASDLLGLKVCDMACGSGAFLVQACRYLSERLMEAWDGDSARVQTGRQGNLFSPQAQGRPILVRITPYGAPSKGDLFEQLVPIDAEERIAFARRIVAERCLYGVDKNPLAVEMAKLSLWLLTLAKDKPFTFLDHAIRCGDSLVGLSSIDQLLRFSMTEDAKVRPLMEQQRQQIEKRLDAVRLLRRQIETLPSNTPQDIERKTLMLANVEDQTKRLTYAADMLLAATWESRNDTELESALNGMLAEVEYKFKDLPVEQLEAEAKNRLRKAGIESRFHWGLEFPEVFMERAGFDTFVCNPPFMGGPKITGNLGTDYRDHLLCIIAGGQRGNSDLCAYFLLRATALLREPGSLGFIATNTIAQGDTREVGLEQLVSAGSRIVRAISNQRWPGPASLHISMVWISRGRWDGPCVLDEQPVPGVTSFLTAPSTVTGFPCKLKANEGIAYKGSDVLGIGFVITEKEAESLLDMCPRCREVVQPFLNGEELYSAFDQKPSRWIINFRDWPLERSQAPAGYEGQVAADYPACLRIVEERVKPFRQRIDKDGNYVMRKPLPEKWWVYNCPRMELYRRISGLELVLTRPETSNTHAIVAISPRIVFSHALHVFASDSFGLLSQLQSSLHECWARYYASSMKTDMRYVSADCFETYPFAEVSSRLTELGRRYSDHRSDMMRQSRNGLTKIYSRFNKPEELAPEIQTLRDLHVELDLAVAAAYGWSDLDLDHGFHETRQGTRFTISESARREVLARLLKLNHERYAQEVAQGFHGKAKGKTAKAPRKSKGKAATEPSLFGEEDG